MKTLLSCLSTVGEDLTLLFKSNFHTRFPLDSFIAYKLPSSDPMNIFPSPYAGEEHIASPVVYVQLVFCEDMSTA